jgi:hypothetical protein
MNRQFPGPNFHPLVTSTFVAHQDVDANAHNLVLVTNNFENHGCVEGLHLAKCSVYPTEILKGEG